MFFQLAGRALLVLALPASGLVAKGQDDVQKRLKQDLAALAGPKMAGRGNGQDGLGKAIGYVVDSYKKLGIKAEIQRFPYRLRNSQNETDGYLSNIIVTINGKDPELHSEYIVVGAHLDHLGARPGQGGGSDIFFGADDNGSGSVALMELVRAFHKDPPARSLIFIHFAGEEWGLLGSKHWVANPTVDISSVRFMGNLDMIGRLGAGRIGSDDGNAMAFTAVGMGPQAIAKAKAMAPKGLNIESDRGSSIFAEASDQAPFAAKNVPTFFMFTGIHNDYHRPTDTIEKINYEGLATITQFAKALIAEYATSRDVPEFQPSGNLGLFVDPTPGAKGARVFHVIPGGSAASAGIAAGDVLTYINEHKIGSPKDFERTLDLFNRSDVVLLKWERGGVKMGKEVALK